jgi:sugar phosphate isomerase/epimerase
MSLACDLGTSLVVVTAGKVPDKEEEPRTPFLVESLDALSRHGDRVGAIVALSTGLEAGEILSTFLNRFDTGGLGVNFDPGALLAGGFNVYDSARALAGRIVHSYASDARSAGPGRNAQEVPLGHGDVDWLYLLGVYEEIGYRGWLSIVRESGASRLADISAGISFLRRLIS